MNEYLITLDGGTTNTRAYLWNEKGEILRMAKEEVGVRNTAIDGHNGRLKQGIKVCLEQLLAEEDILYENVRLIVASGMLSSDVGITEVPHLVAPVTVEDFISGAVKTVLPEICPLPIYIVPGMKNSSTPREEAFEAMDIMRGEETESIPLIKNFGKGEPLLLVLPGSHNKFIAVDANGAITGCLTTISGELLDCITTGTILANATGKRFVSEDGYNKEMLLKGSRNALKTGLNRACFSGRILNLFFSVSQMDIANYLLGVVYGEDLRSVLGSTALKLPKGVRTVIAGKKILCNAIADIMSDSKEFGEIVVVPETNIPLDAQGAYLIAANIKPQ